MIMNKTETVLKEKTILFVFNRISNDFPKIKKLLNERGFAVGLRRTCEKVLVMQDLEKIFKKTFNHNDRKITQFILNSPTKVILLEKENAINELKDFVGPNDRTKAPIGTLTKLFGEYGVACPCDKEHAEKLLDLCNHKISI